MTGIDLIEPQYLALCVFAGFVALSALIYAIASFGMREKTYEEAIAEQRARIDKETQQQHEIKQQRRRQFANRRKKDKEKPGKIVFISSLGTDVEVWATAIALYVYTLFSLYSYSKCLYVSSCLSIKNALTFWTAIFYSIELN